MIFKPLTREEFDRLSLEQRQDYLQRLMADIQQKLADTRRQQEAITRKLDQQPD